ncbi:MAG: DUF983 domain-containing protein [Chloroflexota bacterium]|nr:DUF983 domain-containing protein [Chloroflexota bacterium]
MTEQRYSPSALTVTRVLSIVGRALTLRCPNCGGGSLFTSWFRMRGRCQRCGMRLVQRAEHDNDYFLGAMMFNLVLADLVFAAGMLIWLMTTWPDVPWDLLRYVGLAFMIIAPILFYPLSKTVWLGFDLLFPPLTGDESERRRRDEVEP